MSTNAPYYQMHTSQMNAVTSSPTTAAQHEIQNEEYGSATGRSTKHAAESQHPTVYPEHAVRHTGVDGHGNFEENHNLVELLEAATTAADRDPMSGHVSKPVSAAARVDSKRKRGFSLQDSATASTQDEDTTAKRRRIDTAPTDPSLEPNDVNTAMRSPAPKTSPSPSRDGLLVDARAAGVHSAAALFRRSTSNAARKYTRPPMSKLFMSLNITPENFIALQALAKTYMLSPAHPERQSCVGNRGKGDTDMVKLRLFNCVRDFLTDDGVGEQFFGEHVEKPGERESHEAAAALGEEGSGERLVWPRDGNKIISLVTPLMRRMVTNERQRLYAIDTRKGGKKPDRESIGGHQSSPTPDAEHQLAALDPTLRQQMRSSPSSPHAITTPQHPRLAPALPSPGPNTPTLPGSSTATLPSSTTDPHLTNINIFLLYTPSGSKPVKLDEKRISTTRPAHLTFYNYTAFLEQVADMVSRAELLYPSIKPANEGGESELMGLAAAANALGEGGQIQEGMDRSGVGKEARYTVKTVGPTGWRVIDSAESWYNVLTERAFAIWADGVCNIIIEMGARAMEGGARQKAGEVVMEDV